MKEYMPFSQSTLQALEVLEKRGPLKVSDIAALTGCKANNMGGALKRAVKAGIATVKQGNRCTKNCDIFAAAEGWREVYAARMALYVKQPRKDKPVMQSRYSGISSVFQLGAMA